MHYKYYFLLIYTLTLTHFKIELIANKEKIFINSSPIIKKQNIFPGCVGVLSLGLFFFRRSTKGKEIIFNKISFINPDRLLIGTWLLSIFSLVILMKNNFKKEDEMVIKKCCKIHCINNSLEYKINNEWFMNDDINKNLFNLNYRLKIKIKSLERSVELNIYQKFFILLSIKLEKNISIDIKNIIDKVSFLDYCNMYLKIKNKNIDDLICFIYCF